MNLNNIFNNIPKNLDDEFYENILSSENITVERIVSKGHTAPKRGWYDQDKNEWVILLKGNAELLFDTEEKVKLCAGDYLNIPAHKKHKVVWTDPYRKYLVSHLLLKDDISK